MREVTQEMNTIAEYQIGKAVVRIHPGKLSEAERRDEITAATKIFGKAIMQAEKKKNKKPS